MSITNQAKHALERVIADLDGHTGYLTYGEYVYVLSETGKECGRRLAELAVGHGLGTDSKEVKQKKDLPDL